MSAIIKLIILIALGIGIAVFLVLTADLPNRRPNGFTRSFLHRETLSPVNSAMTGPAVRAIVALTAEHIYLSTDTPNIIQMKDHELQPAETVSIPLKQTLLRRIGKVFSLQLDFPIVYIFASNIPAVVHASAHNGLSHLISVPGSAFSYGVAVSENTFILRQFRKNGKDMHFISWNASSFRTSTENNVSLPSTDGGLSTDGQLHYDGKNRLVYMHYYNNTILTFDTSLVRVKRFHTIDTTSSKISLRSNVPLVTNQKSCVYKNFLLVCSNLKADNETFQEYRNNIPVDIYEIPTGMYKGSFYMPLSEGKLVKSMKAGDNKLVALYHNNRLSLFTLNF